MPTGVWNSTWTNQNAERSYPLLPTGERVAVDGFRLPDAVIVGLILPVYIGITALPTRYFLRQLMVTGNGLSVVISYDVGDGVVDVAEASMSFSGHTENKAYPLIGINALEDVRGHIQFGRLDVLEALAGGVHEFDEDATILDPHVVRPTLRGVRGIVLVNGGLSSEVLDGQIELTAGRNTQWSFQTVGAVDEIRVDAIAGEGLTEDCVCEDDDELPPPIRRINDVTADEQNRIILSGSDCLQISSAGVGRMMIEDVCSKPCCGARELERITADLEQMNAGRAAMDTQVIRLEAVVTQFSYAVIGSRLNDVVCDPSA